MSVQEYLAFEQSSQIKHEFVDGFVFAMAGASENHNLISGNIFGHVWNAARGTSCRVYTGDMRFSITNATYYYPDVFLTCDDSDTSDIARESACFIIEVLSESTGDIDRGEKLRHYRRAPGLQAYVLVSQTQKLVEVYKKLADGSWQHEILEEGPLELPCLDLNLSFDDIYEDVVLAVK